MDVAEPVPGRTRTRLRRLRLCARTSPRAYTSARDVRSITRRCSSDATV